MIPNFYSFTVPAPMSSDSKEHKGAGIKLMNIGNHLSMFYGSTNLDVDSNAVVTGVFAIPQYVVQTALADHSQFGHMGFIMKAVATTLAEHDNSAHEGIEQRVLALYTLRKPLTEIAQYAANYWNGVIQECIFPSDLVFEGAAHAV